MEPLPCPFCGKQPSLAWEDEHATIIDCTSSSHGVIVEAPTREAAILVWNTRNGVPAPQGQGEAGAATEGVKRGS
jgi:hypothetical protein